MTFRKTNAPRQRPLDFPYTRRRGGDSLTLVTGFGPFGQITENPSSKLAQASERPFQVLEVSFKAVDEFLSQLDPSSFERLLMLGVASGRDKISLEIYARNSIGPHKDVRGEGQEGLIEAGAPTLLEATLWTPENSSEIVAYDLCTRISMDAGAYLCNYISYRALQRFPEKKVGFLHVTAEKSMPIEEQAKSLQRILQIIER